jgi:uncharacterized membrane protein YcaP (DUF421 family)
LRALMQAKPLRLVEDGRILRRNLRKEMISHDELMTALRGAGVERLEQVKLAVMESSGEISVISDRG